MARGTKHVRTTIDLRSLSSHKSGSKLLKDISKKSLVKESSKKSLVKDISKKSLNQTSYEKS